MSGRTLLALGSLALLAGCGSTKTVVKTVTQPAASAGSPSHTMGGSPSDTAPADGMGGGSPNAAPDPTPTPTGCDAKGIDPTSGTKEGTCRTSGGQRTVVVNHGSTLRLRTLSATLSGMRVVDSLSGSPGAGSATAHGKFVVLTLTVSNKLDSPQTFDHDQSQAALSDGKRTYTENFDAENGPDEQSFVWKGSNNGGIQPGESETGDIVFDVPSKVATKIAAGTSNGFIGILNFGEPSNGTLGDIRLHGATSG